MTLLSYKHYVVGPGHALGFLTKSKHGPNFKWVHLFDPGPAQVLIPKPKPGQKQDGPGQAWAGFIH